MAQLKQFHSNIETDYLVLYKKRVTNIVEKGTCNIKCQTDSEQYEKANGKIVVNALIRSVNIERHITKFLCGQFSCPTQGNITMTMQSIEAVTFLFCPLCLHRCRE